MTILLQVYFLHQHAAAMHHSINECLILILFYCDELRPGPLLILMIKSMKNNWIYFI
jgi:hypothetical protein